MYGGEGQDSIVGDFGLYDARVEVWPFRHISSIIDYPEYGGRDYIEGNQGDDYLIGSEDGDTLRGGDGSDDIIGGHNTCFGSDKGDALYGDEDDDYILGDNGDILREIESIRGEFPWTTYNWKRYPAPFDSEKMRDVRRYDDIDKVRTDDKIYGGTGSDILHGQRGDDEIHGEEGNDELYGELGVDTLYGGPGEDILIGDIGYAVRRYSFGTPLTKNGKPDVWHKDIVLEELGNISSITRCAM